MAFSFAGSAFAVRQPPAAGTLSLHFPFYVLVLIQYTPYLPSCPAYLLNFLLIFNNRTVCRTQYGFAKTTKKKKAFWAFFSSGLTWNYSATLDLTTLT